ncbi:MAG: tetratricopeptide repeat protein [Robiginitomaculum sp.]|nr:tetratricopeptide repeat protein [Robiginitomaculum sp.]
MRNLAAFFIGIVTCLIMSGCATTTASTTKTTEVDVRPVVKSTGLVEAVALDVGAELSRARKLQNASDFAASLVIYEDTLARMSQAHPSRADIEIGLADSALALAWRGEKYAQQARKTYQAISGNAEYSDAIKRRAKSGLLLLDLARDTPEIGAQKLQAALETNPNNPRLWNALGEIRDKNNDWMGALDVYVKALRAAKRNGTSTAAVVNNMGMSLLMQGRNKEAVSKFKQAKKANPEMPVYDSNYRLAQILSGKTNKALKGVSETRAAQIYNDAGVIAQSHGNTRQASSLYKKALEISPVYFERAEENLAGLSPIAQLVASATRLD